jgi:regulation of enolase protein 1 (concanavalin A-like superfamily)
LNVTWVLIEDPNATLAAPWQQAIVGNVTEFSAAVSAEDVIGSAVRGGGINNSDNGRFISQAHTGDGVLSVHVEPALPEQKTARIGLMIRDGLTPNGLLSAALLGAEGATLTTRVKAGSDVVSLPAAKNPFKAPCWLRLTRRGDSFTAEHSPDGTVWTVLGTETLAIPATANWGLFHCSENGPDFQLARFGKVTLSDSVPAIPK